MFRYRILIRVQSGEGVVYFGGNDIQEILNNGILMLDKDLIGLQRLNDTPSILTETETINAMSKIGRNTLKIDEQISTHYVYYGTSATDQMKDSGHLQRVVAIADNYHFLEKGREITLILPY